MSYTRRGLQQRAGSIGAITLVAVLMAASASASSIQVSGSTAGCFGAGCDSFGSLAIHGTYELAFTGTAFDVFTDDLGLASNLLLGSFARGNANVSSSTASVPFTLQVVFSQPTGIGGDEQLTALINGTNYGGGGGLDVDFDNEWQLVNYTNGQGSGSFEFAVIEDLDLNKNGSEDVYGEIRNATFTSGSTPLEESVTTVPEPASIGLFGVGLLMVARRVRRRKP